MTRLFLILTSFFWTFEAMAEANFIDEMNRAQVNNLKKQMNSDDEIFKAAKQYEAVAITKMLQQMYSDVKLDPLFENKNTENIYKDLLLTEYGKIVAENGGIGLAKAITKDAKKSKGIVQ